MKAATVGMFSCAPGDVLRVRFVQVRETTSDQHRDADGESVLALIEALHRYAATLATSG